MLERPAARPPGLNEILARLTGRSITGGIVAALFATTGPLAIILSVARLRGLDDGQVTNWIFAGYAVGGVLSLAFSWLYRQPIGMAWTIPGAAMLLVALERLSFGEMVAASLLTGLVLTFLGLSGWIGWLMARVPVAIVMGMVAGVFLPIGLELVTGFETDPVLSAVTVAGFLVPSMLPRVGRLCPPVLGALAAGGVMVAVQGQVGADAIGGAILIRPELAAPTFSWRLVLELVVPFTIAVVAIQNLQGVTILRQAGHEPPVNVLTVACGYGTLAMGAFGSVPACITGPVNGIIVAAARPEERFAGGMVFGLLILAFGVFAPFTTRLADAVPVTLIGVLGALAMLPVLSGAFRAAFAGETHLGTLVAFMVTVSGLKLFNIGAPFWGLVFGYATALLLERAALLKAIAPDGVKQTHQHKQGGNDETRRKSGDRDRSGDRHRARHDPGDAGAGRDGGPHAPRRG